MRKTQTKHFTNPTVKRTYTTAKQEVSTSKIDLHFKKLIRPEWESHSSPKTQNHRVVSRTETRPPAMAGKREDPRPSAAILGAKFGIQTCVSRTSRSRLGQWPHAGPFPTGNETHTDRKRADNASLQWWRRRRHLGRDGGRVVININVVFVLMVRNMARWVGDDWIDNVRVVRLNYLFLYLERSDCVFD